jgi:hypothetical protein
VDILAEEGNFGAALCLESLWNDLAARVSFTLLCGYASAHFASAETAQLLRGICAQHSHVAVAPEDAMAQWVLDRQPTSSFLASATRLRSISPSPQNLTNRP